MLLSSLEPFLLLFHLAASVAVFFLSRKLGLNPRVSCLAALLFALHPGITSHPALHHYIFYALSVPLSIGLSWGMGRMYGFLKNQEAILRHLFTAGVAMLLIGMVLLTYNQVVMWQDPVKLWRHQVKINPKPENYSRLAEALKNTGEYQTAVKQYRQYMDLISQGQSEAKIAIDKSQFDKVQEIIDLYTKAISLTADHIEFYDQLGQVYESIGKFDEARGIYDKALGVQANSSDILFGLANLHLKLNQPAQAVDVFERLLKFYPEDEGIYTRIIDAYGKAIEAHPEQKIYKEQREVVLSDYEEVSKRKKYTHIDYFNLGFLYEQVGGYEEAIRYYKKSIELKHSYEKPLLNLANIYQQAGDFKTALLLYQQLLHFHPKNSLGYLNMGIIYHALGDAPRARMLYQKAIDLDPKAAKPYFYLGYLCESAGELKDALNYYEKAIENDPQEAEAYYNRGNVYAALGQEAEAMASYLKTISINKNHQNTYVNLSILSFKSRDFAGAIHYLEEAQLLGYNPPAEYLKSLEPYRKK